MSRMQPRRRRFVLRSRLVPALAAACLVPLAAVAEAPAPPPAVIAVVGGTVHTMGAAGTLEGATVLLRDGK